MTAPWLVAPEPNTVVYGVQWSADGRLELAPDRVVIDGPGTMSVRRTDTWAQGQPGLTILSLVLPQSGVEWGHVPPYAGAGIMLLAEVPAAEIDPDSLMLLRRPV